jgi:hypothetical protein
MRHVARQFGFAAVIALAAVLAADSASAMSLGMKRCKALDMQVSELVRKAKFTPPHSVIYYADQGRELCLKGKSAQGLRAYAKALNLLGTKPVLPKD